MLFVNLKFLVLISPQFHGHLQRLFRVRASFKQSRTRAVVSLGVLTVSNYNFFLNFFDKIMPSKREVQDSTKENAIYY